MGGSDADDTILVALLTRWSPDSLADESDLNTKMLHLDPQEAPRQQSALRALRQQLDAAGRLAKAEEYKKLANAQFGKQAWRVALVGYLAAIWLLRRDKAEPPCPRLLANHLSELDEAVSALGVPVIDCSDAGDGSTAGVGDGLVGDAGDGSAAGAGDGSAGGAGDRSDSDVASGVAIKLECSLRLNLAAAALKLNEWRLARIACEWVLAYEPANSKALWRLTKAHEGDSNLTDAIGAATRLARADPTNQEASKLLETLQMRKKKKGKMFGSIVERAHAEGDTLYTKREHERDVSEAMHKGFVRCFSRRDGEEEEEERGEEVEAAGDGEAAGAPGVSGTLSVATRQRAADNDEDEPKNMTVGEVMEAEYRNYVENKKPFTEDEKTLNKVMGNAYMKTRAMREEGVKASLPPNVLASYVDP